MKKIIFILCVFSFIVNAKNSQPDLNNNDKQKAPVLEMTIEETQVIVEEAALEPESIPSLELSPQKTKQEIESDWKEKVVDLELTPKEAHEKKPDKDKLPLWKIMGNGMMRGLANIVLSPGEIVRGFTYEYTAKKWTTAVFTSGVAALGGMMGRMGAGVADVVTLGYFGDVQLVEGFPEYVWQGEWIYKEVQSTKKTKTKTK